MTTYEWYKARGICVKCHNAEAQPGKVHCAKCARKDIERKMKRYDRLKTDGLCVECGKNPVDGGVLCQKCKDRRDEQLRQNRIIWGATGMCVDCGSKPAVQGKRLCVACQTRKNELNRKYRERVKA